MRKTKKILFGLGFLWLMVLSSYARAEVAVKEGNKFNYDISASFPEIEEEKGQGTMTIDKVTETDDNVTIEYSFAWDEDMEFEGLPTNGTSGWELNVEDDGDDFDSLSDEEKLIALAFIAAFILMGDLWVVPRSYEYSASGVDDDGDELTISIAWNEDGVLKSLMLEVSGAEGESHFSIEMKTALPGYDITILGLCAALGIVILLKKRI